MIPSNRIPLFEDYEILDAIVTAIMIWIQVSDKQQMQCFMQTQNAKKKRHLRSFKLGIYNFQRLYYDAIWLQIRAARRFSEVRPYVHFDFSLITEGLASLLNNAVM